MNVVTITSLYDACHATLPLGFVFNNPKLWHTTGSLCYRQVNIIVVDGGMIINLWNITFLNELHNECQSYSYDMASYTSVEGQRHAL